MSNIASGTPNTTSIIVSDAPRTPRPRLSSLGDYWREEPFAHVDLANNSAANDAQILFDNLDSMSRLAAWGIELQVPDVQVVAFLNMPLTESQRLEIARKGTINASVDAVLSCCTASTTSPLDRHPDESMEEWCTRKATLPPDAPRNTSKHFIRDAGPVFARSKPSKVFHTILYNGEEDMLRMLLHHVTGYVDVVVIVEAKVTSSGRRKRLRFPTFLQRERSRLPVDIVYAVPQRPLKAKTYVTSHDVKVLKRFHSSERDAFRAEFSLRRVGVRVVSQGLHGDPDDLVVIGDVDEFPFPFQLTYLRHCGPHILKYAPPPRLLPAWFVVPTATPPNASSLNSTRINATNDSAVNDTLTVPPVTLTPEPTPPSSAHLWTLPLRSYFYDFCCYSTTDVSYLTVATLLFAEKRLAKARACHWLSDCVASLPQKKSVLQYGWHASFFMSVTGIQDKVRSYAHMTRNREPYNTTEWIRESVEQCRDPFDRKSMKLEELLQTNLTTGLMRNTRYLRPGCIVRSMD